MLRKARTPIKKILQPAPWRGHGDLDSRGRAEIKTLERKLTGFAHISQIRSLLIYLTRNYFPLYVSQYFRPKWVCCQDLTLHYLGLCRHK